MKTLLILLMLAAPAVAQRIPRCPPPRYYPPVRFYRFLPPPKPVVGRKNLPTVRGYRKPLAYSKQRTVAGIRRDMMRYPELKPEATSVLARLEGIEDEAEVRRVMERYRQRRKEFTNRQ